MLFHLTSALYSESTKDHYHYHQNSNNKNNQIKSSMNFDKIFDSGSFYMSHQFRH